MPGQAVLGLELAVELGHDEWALRHDPANLLAMRSIARIVFSDIGPVENPDRSPVLILEAPTPSFKNLTEPLRLLLKAQISTAVLDSYSHRIATPT